MNPDNSPGFAESRRPDHVRLVIERMMQDAIPKADRWLSSASLTPEQQVRLALWELNKAAVRIRRMEPMAFGRGNEPVYR